MPLFVSADVTVVVASPPAVEPWMVTVALAGTGPARLSFPRSTYAVPAPAVDPAPKVRFAPRSATALAATVPPLCVKVSLVPTENVPPFVIVPPLCTKPDPPLSVRPMALPALTVTVPLLVMVAPVTRVSSLSIVIVPLLTIASSRLRGPPEPWLVRIVPAFVTPEPVRRAIRDGSVPVRSMEPLFVSGALTVAVALPPRSTPGR